MKTTHIRYRRLESHKGGYGHDAVELEAQLEAGDDPETAFLALRKQVLARLGHITDLHVLTSTIEELTENIARQRRLHDKRAAILDEQKRMIERNADIIGAHADLARLAADRGIATEALRAQLASDWSIKLPTPAPDQ